MSDETEDSEATDAELAQSILDSSDAEDLGELEGRVFCGDCGSAVEIDMERVFEYVLRKEYGMRPQDLEQK